MDTEDFDAIIDEPLTTDEGFMNEAGVNALFAAIEKMPPTYERLAGEPEWEKPRWIHYFDITGAFAKWAIRQSPYHLPEHLVEVLGYLDASLRRAVKWTNEGMAELSLCEINLLLHGILMDKGISYFDAWNSPKKNWRDRPDADDLDQPWRGDPDYDFIDLHALLHNVCIDIRDERRDDDRFDVAFEAKYGEALRCREGDSHARDNAL